MTLIMEKHIGFCMDIYEENKCLDCFTQNDCLKLKRIEFDSRKIKDRRKEKRSKERRQNG